jgi:hypothetical protein
MGIYPRCLVHSHATRDRGSLAFSSRNWDVSAACLALSGHARFSRTLVDHMNLPSQVLLPAATSLSQMPASKGSAPAPVAHTTLTGNNPMTGGELRTG